MSGGALVPFVLSPRNVPREPAGGLRERDPRILAGGFLVGMAIMYRLVGCTVALQAYLLAFVMAVFQGWLARQIDDSTAWVGMAALAALVVLIPQDLASCLTIPETAGLVKNCTVWKGFAMPLMQAMKADVQRKLFENKVGGAFDHLKEVLGK